MGEGHAFFHISFWRVIEKILAGEGISNFLGWPLK